MSGVAKSLTLLLLVAVAAPLTAQTDGQAIYAKYCSQCHGENGDGQGIAARFLKPEPRDFTSGKYKIRSTETGNLPTDADLERVVKIGLPYTSMPAFPNLTNAQVSAVVGHLKTFSADFEDPELAPEPIPLPSPPSYSEEGAAKGREVYEATGCARCHGTLGRGDGTSAPTLTDDWGNHIRAANLSMPWTFRGGGTRQDIFRTMSTGFNGTPMPGFYGALPEEDIWSIVDFIVSLSGNTVEEPYANLVRSIATRESLELTDDLFSEAPTTVLPIVGQIIEPGRNFYPSIIAVGVQAIHNHKDVAFRLRWHDMRAETAGTNAPDLPAPLWDDELAALGQLEETGSGDDEEGFWGDEEAGGDDEDFWGEATVSEEADSGDFWGDDAAPDDAAGEAGDDFWGEETGSEDAGGGDDFWGEGDAEPAAVTTPETEFSDAVALQFPLEMPQGIRLPYFLLGDTQNAVQLWHADLGANASSAWVARGSAAVSPGDSEPPKMTARYEDGEWSVLFKQPRRPQTGLTFEEGAFIPLAVTVWDGFNRERGNRRGLTPWYHLYLEPLEKPSSVRPMLKAGLGVLGLELLIIGFVRMRKRSRRPDVLRS
ncbi:MAG: c-type cytochrome [Acidobacteriota bacterium]|nr:c-type cytochrome [Acidobacteriota bacterium]